MRGGDVRLLTRQGRCAAATFAFLPDRGGRGGNAASLPDPINMGMYLADISIYSLCHNSIMWPCQCTGDSHANNTINDTEGAAHRNN